MRRVLAHERGWRMSELTVQVALGEPGLAEREQTAFTALVERQSRFVFRVAYAIVRNAADAEDVVQETFLRVFRAGALDEMRDERAFLARTAWRIAVKKRRRPDVEVDPETPGTAVNPEDAAVSADWHAAVHRLIDALPEELRQPLALSAVDEMTSREIAEVMGITEGTVRTRIMRARQILKQKLAGGRYGR